MFSFLTQKSDGTMVEVTTSDLIKLSASKFAWNRCVNIISDAVAKSEVLVYHGAEHSPEDDALYYKLNISPNSNETGTEFWKLLTRQLLTKQEAMIIPLNGMFYRAISWQETSSIIHNMWIDVCGNAEDLRKAADDLDAFMDSCVALYMSRAKGLTEQQLRKMLDESTVLTPELALQYGFADAVGETPENPEGMDPEAQKDKPADPGDDEHDADPSDPDEALEQHADSDPKQNKETQINKGIGFNAFFDSAD